MAEVEAPIAPKEEEHQDDKDEEESAYSDPNGKV